MVIEEVNLKHVLTDSELAGLARAQAQAIDKLKSTEADLAAIKKDFGGRIALANAEVGSISTRVNAGFEMRNIRCLLLDERPEGYRLVVRTDNGHIERRRKLNPEERQLKLSTEPPKPFAFSALLPVDDPTWETDIFQVALFADEADELRNVPHIELVAIVPRRAIEPPADKKDGKKK